MSARKQRLTVTVDPELVAAAGRAVAEGRADSVSGWVSAALSEKVERDQRLAHLQAAIAGYEAEFGEISVEEIRAQERADRESAVVVRGRQAGAARSGRRVTSDPGDLAELAAASGRHVELIRP